MPSGTNPVVCLEAADRTLGGKIHAYANVLAAGRGFTAPEADLAAARNAAQTLANSLEILGDAQPTRPTTTRSSTPSTSTRPSPSCRGRPTSPRSKARITLRARPPPRRRRRGRGGRRAAPAPGPAPPPPRARPRPRRARPRRAVTAHDADERRPGARPARRQRAGVDEGLEEAGRLGEQRGARPAGGCGRRSPRATSDAGSARPASSRPMRPRLNTASARESVSGRTPRASGVARSRSGTMTTKASSSAQRQRRRARARRRPWWRPPGRRTRWPPRSRGARRRRRRRAKGSSAPAAAAAAAASAADEPRPRATGICERTVTAKRSWPRTSVDDPGGQVRRVVEEAGALALGVHAERRRPARPRRSRSSRAPRPGCRTPARGWPTTRGPGRARRQARRQKGAGDSVGAWDVLSRRTGTADPLGAERDDHRPDLRAARGPGSATWRAGTNDPRAR